MLCEEAKAPGLAQTGEGVSLGASLALTRRDGRDGVDKGNVLPSNAWMPWTYARGRKLKHGILKVGLTRGFSPMQTVQRWTRAQGLSPSAMDHTIDEVSQRPSQPDFEHVQWSSINIISEQLMQCFTILIINKRKLLSSLKTTIFQS